VGLVDNRGLSCDRRSASPSFVHYGPLGAIEICPRQGVAEGVQARAVRERAPFQSAALCSL